jgi:hypothetical protein
MRQPSSVRILQGIMSCVRYLEVAIAERLETTIMYVHLLVAINPASTSEQTIHEKTMHAIRVSPIIEAVRNRCECISKESALLCEI